MAELGDIDLVDEVSRAPWAVSASALRRACFCDLATSTSTRADFTVISTVGADESGSIYILDIRRGRWEWPQAREEIKREVLRQGVDLVGVEVNGFQKSGFQELISDPEVSHIAFVPVKQDTDKLSRALLVSSKAANGKLFIRQGASWAEALIYEFVTFPGQHDDIVDAVTGAVELLLRSSARGKETAAPVSIKKPTGRIRKRRRQF